MEVKALRTGQIQIRSLKTSEFRLLKENIRQLLQYEYTINDIHAVHLAVLQELYSEKFNSEFLPKGNKHALITISIKPSQALALRATPMIVHVSQEAYEHTLEWFKILKYCITDALLQLTQVNCTKQYLANSITDGNETRNTQGFIES